MSVRTIGSASAWLLIALIALPFTAPFSACDLSMLTTPASQAVSARIGHDGRAASIEQGRTQDAAGSCLDEEQFKDTILASSDVTIAAAVSDAPITPASKRRSAPRLPFTSLRL